MWTQGLATSGIGTTGQIVDNAYVDPEGQWSYAVANAVVAVTHIGMTFSFLPGTGAGKNAVTMGIMPSTFAGDGTITASLHLNITVTGFAMSYWTTSGGTSTEHTVASESFPTPLPTDGSIIAADVVINGANVTLHISSSNYATGTGYYTFTNQNFKSNNHWVFFEHSYGSASGVLCTTVSTIHSVWAGAASPQLSNVVVPQITTQAVATPSNTLTGTAGAASGSSLPANTYYAKMVALDTGGNPSGAGSSEASCTVDGATTTSCTFAYNNALLPSGTSAVLIYWATTSGGESSNCISDPALIGSDTLKSTTTETCPGISASGTSGNGYIEGPSLYIGGATGPGYIATATGTANYENTVAGSYLGLSSSGAVSIHAGQTGQNIVLTPSSGGYTEASGFMLAGAGFGNATNATIAAGAAISGTGAGYVAPACAANHKCTGTSGTVTFTTGSTSPAAGILLTITDANSHTNVPDCWAQTQLAAAPYTEVSSQAFSYSHTVWTLNVGVALAASASYTVTYGCFGY
jgi:hypothetical protein